MSTPNRVQPGVPAGGQFAAHQHAEADTELVDDLLRERRPDWVPSGSGHTVTYFGSTLGVAQFGSDPDGPHVWNQVGPGGFARGVADNRDEAMLAAEQTACRTAPPPTEQTRWVDNEDGGSLATFSDGRFMEIHEASGADAGGYYWSVGVDGDSEGEDGGYSNDFEQARRDAEAVLADRFPPRAPMSSEQLAEWGLDRPTVWST